MVRLWHTYDIVLKVYGFTCLILCTSETDRQSERVLNFSSSDRSTISNFIRAAEGNQIELKGCLDSIKMSKFILEHKSAAKG